MLCFRNRDPNHLVISLTKVERRGKWENPRFEIPTPSIVNIYEGDCVVCSIVSQYPVVKAEHSLHSGCDIEIVRLWFDLPDFPALKGIPQTITFSHLDNHCMPCESFKVSQMGDGEQITDFIGSGPNMAIMNLLQWVYHM